MAGIAKRRKWPVQLSFRNPEYVVPYLLGGVVALLSVGSLAFWLDVSVLGVPLLLAIGFGMSGGPRVSTDDSQLEIRLLLWKWTIPWGEVTALRIESRSSYFSTRVSSTREWGKIRVPARLLIVERCGARPLVLHGRPTVLEELAGVIDSRRAVS